MAAPVFQHDIRFSRVELALGSQNLEKLKNAFVIVCGLGAVGGIAAEAMIRSGIGRIRVIDVDVVQYPNFNRQILATETSLGKPKVQAAVERFLQINPGAVVEPVCEFIHKESVEHLLEGTPDFVFDAIDAAGPKIELLAFCHRKRIPVISSMGAAFKRDFSKIRIADISETKVCPLAKTIRRGLHRRGIYSGIPVIFSEEQGPPFLEPEQIGNPQMDTITHRGRPRRILGSLCSSAGIVGLIGSHYMIWSLIDRRDSREIPLT